MTEMAIEPYGGLGELRFGMPRSRVHELLDEAPDPFEKTEGKHADAFSDTGLHVHYEDDEVSFIETTSPLGVVHEGLRLSVGDRMEDALAAARDAGVDVQEVDSDLFVLTDAGAALWTKDGETVASVGILPSRDYYG